MRVKSVSIMSIAKKTSNVSSANFLSTLSTPNDSFVKQKDISFTGFRKNKKEIKEVKHDNLGSSLCHLNMKGGSFLLGLVTSVAMVKMGKEASELLLDDDGYVVSGTGIKSDLVNIDTENQIIKFEGTGIEIDAKDCDVVDFENGIFRNYDGSVDIDLGNNKFIDTENGIFVDPDAEISAVMDGERLQNIAVPNFGSGHDLFPWDGDDDQPYTLKSAKTEEEEKSLFKKFIDFWKGDRDSDDVTEDSGIKDIFGNSIIAATDKDGDRYFASYMPEIDDNSVFAPFKKIMNRETIVETANNIKLQSYMEDKFPAFGTRIQVYEGGRNAHLSTPLKEYEKYDHSVYDLRDKIINEGYEIESGSDEAINFVKYQNHMLKLGIWDKPLAEPNELLGLDEDGEFPDLDDDGIPDFDNDDDGIIELSSEEDRGMIGELIYTIRKLFN